MGDVKLEEVELLEVIKRLFIKVKEVTVFHFLSTTPVTVIGRYL